jgi:hypothetical protein
MLNLVQHLIKSMNDETLKRPMKQVQGMVQHRRVTCWEFWDGPRLPAGGTSKERDLRYGKPPPFLEYY